MQASRVALKLTNAVRSCGVRALSADAAPPVIKPVAVLNYVYVENMAEKRAPHRAAHLAHAREAAAKGDLLIGGAFEDMEHGMMLFRSAAAAEEFGMNDPYVLNELVPHFGIRMLSAAAGSFHEELS